MILLFNGNPDREGAVMQTCLLILLSETVDGDIITLEVASYHGVFSPDEVPTEEYGDPHHMMAGGENWVRLQLLDNHDGTYSLLTYQEPDDGETLYKDVKLIFSESTAETLSTSAKKAFWDTYYELAEENWAAFCSRDTSDEGTPVFLEMNVTSDDVRLNLTYLREPENYPASNIREYTMADGTTYIWIVME